MNQRGYYVRIFQTGFDSIFIVVVFFYILINSNTVETTTEVYTGHSGLPQQRANYVFHWDRFGNYIINTPERIKKLFDGSKWGHDTKRKFTYAKEFLSHDNQLSERIY